MTVTIKKSFPKGADGQRQALYSVHDGEPVALVTFSNLADAVLVARFLAGGNLADKLTERAVELLEDLEGDERE